MFTIKSKYDILKIVNTAKEEKEDQCLHGRQCKQHNVLCTRNGSDNYRSGSDGNSDR